MTTIGFIGLGHMGNPMVRNLLKAGYKVNVYDVMPEMMQALAKHGAVSVPSVAELAKNSDIVITSVQTGQQVKEICLGTAGIFTNLRSESLYIDCSSIDIITTRALHEEAQAHHIAMLDAPVSGGVTGAEAATLTFMVGGSATDFERAQPLFNTLGKTLVHAGSAGCGQAAKICNNLILGISMIAVSEAFTLAQKMGLDQRKFFEISSHASGQCWSMTSYCPVPNILENVPSNHQYQPGFMAKMMLKDLRLGQHAAEAVNSAIPLGAVAAELYELYVDQGLGEKDFSGIINLFKDEKK